MTHRNAGSPRRGRFPGLSGDGRAMIAEAAGGQLRSAAIAECGVQGREPTGGGAGHPAEYAIPRAKSLPGGKLAVDGLPPDSEEMAILTCPDCGVKVQPEDLICFRCGANLPHAPYADDDIPS